VGKLLNVGEYVKIKGHQRMLFGRIAKKKDDDQFDVDVFFTGQNKRMLVDAAIIDRLSDDEFVYMTEHFSDAFMRAGL